jgi:hypothetical protein
MRFMIIVRATPESEAEASPLPEAGSEELLAEMTAFHEEMARAGVLVDGAGLQPSRKGWRVRYEGGKRSVIDGPFADTAELIAGYTVIKVASREEALAWSRRFPSPFPGAARCEIEVRQLYEMEDFGDSPAAERLRELDMGRPVA